MFGSSERSAANPHLLIRNRAWIFRFVVASGALTLFCSAASPEVLAAPQGWRIDEVHTSIGFKIDAVGFPTTRGHFKHYSGRILIDFERPGKSFTTFTVESTSIDAGSESFTDFIKGPALLDVEKFPRLTFTSTQVDKVDNHTARVTGNLTMIGVTKPITLVVNVDTDPSAKDRVVAFQAIGKIARSEFGMIFGIPLIDDAIEITVKTRALADE